MCSIRIHQKLPATAAGKTKRAPGPLALFNSPGNHIMMLSILTCFKLYLGKQNPSVEMIVLLPTSQKLWHIINSLCLKGTKGCVSYNYSQILNKRAFTQTQFIGPAGIWMSWWKKKKEEAHFAAVIISITGVCTEESKNKGDIQLQ